MKNRRILPFLMVIGLSLTSCGSGGIISNEKAISLFEKIKNSINSSEYNIGNSKGILTGKYRYSYGDGMQGEIQNQEFTLKFDLKNYFCEYTNYQKIEQKFIGTGSTIKEFHEYKLYELQNNRLYYESVITETITSPNNEKTTDTDTFSETFDNKTEWHSSMKTSVQPYKDILENIFASIEAFIYKKTESTTLGSSNTPIYYSDNSGNLKIINSNESDETTNSSNLEICFENNNFSFYKYSYDRPITGFSTHINKEYRYSSY